MTDERTFSDWILHFSSTVEEWVLELSESLWIYPGVFFLSLIDGIFPVLPSESVIIATSTASFQTGSPILVLIFLCGAVGAWCGDQIAYLVGSRVDVRHWRLFKRDRWRHSLDWAESQLERRGTTFIIAARFIPMGRVIVNLTAGALRFPHRRFMGVDAVAVSIWAAWGILLGTAAGAIFPKDNLLLSIIVGVVAGVLLGLVVDKVLGWFGLTEPELPDLAGDIEESLTPEDRERQAEIERHRAERKEERTGRKEERVAHRAERRAGATGQIPEVRRTSGADAPDGAGVTGPVRADGAEADRGTDAQAATDSEPTKAGDEDRP
ncbi:DedA family protein [Demequina sp. NBRC 110056]|uniref:DedA family protein n=1 Tax=Demequina sp. NBRC 110056 TaxID=1570345 RepID=UPI0013566879|nr:DedA family protein [Demequina sp. NBRC 110056]